MAGLGVQGVAVVELGPDAGSLVDYSCEVGSFVITEGRSTVQKPPSFGSPSLEELASANTAAVTMTFTSQPFGSSGLWLVMRTAQKTLTGELFFRVKYFDAPVSASNPSRTGWLKVTDLDSGAPVNGTRVQSKTFPARGVSDLITT